MRQCNAAMQLQHGLGESGCAMTDDKLWSASGLESDRHFYKGFQLSFRATADLLSFVQRSQWPNRAPVMGTKCRLQAWPWRQIALLLAHHDSFALLRLALLVLLNTHGLGLLGNGRKFGSGLSPHTLPGGDAEFRSRPAMRSAVTASLRPDTVSSSSTC